MYQVGDRVVYGIHGVCRVIAHEKQMIDRKPVVYLVLEPVDYEGSRYLLPVHNEVAMAKLRELMSLEELQMLLLEKTDSGDWVPEENRRKQYYRDLLSGNDPRRILAVIRGVLNHRQMLQESGKKVHQCDENFLHDAQRLIAGEIAAVMDISFAEALEKLRNTLQ